MFLPMISYAADFIFLTSAITLAISLNDSGRRSNIFAFLRRLVALAVSIYLQLQAFVYSEFLSHKKVDNEIKDVIKDENLASNKPISKDDYPIKMLKLYSSDPRNLYQAADTLFSTIGRFEDASKILLFLGGADIKAAEAYLELYKEKRSQIRIIINCPMLLNEFEKINKFRYFMEVLESKSRAEGVYDYEDVIVHFIKDVKDSLDDDRPPASEILTRLEMFVKSGEINRVKSYISVHSTLNPDEMFKSANMEGKKYKIGRIFIKDVEAELAALFKNNTCNKHPPYMLPSSREEINKKYIDLFENGIFGDGKRFEKIDIRLSPVGLLSSVTAAPPKSYGKSDFRKIVLDHAGEGNGEFLFEDASVKSKLPDVFDGGKSEALKWLGLRQHNDNKNDKDNKGKNDKNDNKDNKNNLDLKSLLLDISNEKASSLPQFNDKEDEVDLVSEFFSQELSKDYGDNFNYIPIKKVYNNEKDGDVKSADDYSSASEEAADNIGEICEDCSDRNCQSDFCANNLFKTTQFTENVNKSEPTFNMDDLIKKAEYGIQRASLFQIDEDEFEGVDYSRQNQVECKMDQRDFRRSYWDES